MDNSQDILYDIQGLHLTKRERQYFDSAWQWFLRSKVLKKMTFPFPKGGIFIGDRVKGTIHVDVRMGMNDRKGWLKYERNNV
jgi:hypothetical protein